jgi:trafficking protein particle complex subunit 9
VSDLLMGAADGAKALIDASDQLILYIETVRLFGTLGYKRKAAFFSRQVAQLYLQQDNSYAAMSGMQILTMTTNAYHVQSRKNNKADHDSHKVGLSKVRHTCSIPRINYHSYNKILLIHVIVSYF